MIYIGDDGDTVILGKAGGLWRCVIDPVLYYIYPGTRWMRGKQESYYRSIYMCIYFLFLPFCLFIFMYSICDPKKQTNKKKLVEVQETAVNSPGSHVTWGLPTWSAFETTS